MPPACVLHHVCMETRAVDHLKSCSTRVWSLSCLWIVLRCVTEFAFKRGEQWWRRLVTSIPCLDFPRARWRGSTQHSTEKASLITSSVCWTRFVKGLSISDFTSLLRFCWIRGRGLGDLSGRKTSGTKLNACLFLALGRRKTF